jgi:hypothetical protein
VGAVVQVTEDLVSEDQELRGTIEAAHDARATAVAAVEREIGEELEDPLSSAKLLSPWALWPLDEFHDEMSPLNARIELSP